MSIRTFLITCTILVGIHSYASAQKIIFVRAGGNDASDGSSESLANKTIQGALQDAVLGDIIDVGAGTFDGAMIPFSITIKGANSGAEMSHWAAPTLMKSPFTLAASETPVEATFDGITFGQITPVTGKSPNAIVSVSNCVFNVSKPLTTEDTDWSELVVVGCVFKAKVKDVSAVAEHAVIADRVSVAYLAETLYSDYTKSAVHLKGVTRLAKLQYNEFTNCNSSGAANNGAVVFDLDGQDTEVEIQKNLMTNCRNGIQTSGNVAGKMISVQYNKFVGIPTSFTAIAHTGTGPLNATCNAIQLPPTEPKPERSVLQETFTKLFVGQIDAFPLNDGAEDAETNAVGFEPKDNSCTFTKR